MKAWMGAVALVAGLAAAGVASTAQAGVLDHAFRRLAGQERVTLAEAYKGQVLLVVNTASKCGLTPQYEGLEALHQTYSSKGFAVLGFPSNDFMGQEPGTEAEIQEFCTLTYGVKFPMFEKVVVRGAEATPMYRDLARITGESPAWNFHKYLIGRDGEVLASFGSRTKPDAPEIVEAIEKAIAEPVPGAAASNASASSGR